jgi:tetratricopeptide (TPR) repeat protein
LIEAANIVREALAQTTDSLDLLRVQAICMACQGDDQQAISILKHAAQIDPESTTVANDLANALAVSGDLQPARDLWRRVHERAPEACVVWPASVLGVEGCCEPLPSGYRADLLFRLANAHVAFGNILVQLGCTADAAREYRAAIATRREHGDAWVSLANLKTIPIDEVDRGAMRDALGNADLSQRDRIPIQFALAKACEDAGEVDEAFALFGDANRRVRRSTTWSALAVDRHVDATIAACGSITAPAPDPAQGHEVILVVSLPRSGSTLVEQMLAAHPDVEGASELSHLGFVLRDESDRRRRPFPDWLGEATPADWLRLGRDYLARTAHWRHDKPRFTDKMPDNWLYAGVALAMLPGARIVNARRDPVETCWSCYKQLFYGGQEFSYDLDDLAAYWKSYDRACRAWRAMHPTRFTDVIYEELLAHPESRIRELLAFCDLSFDPACLNPHEVKRRVRTVSAAQVREPLRRDTARTARYGALLDPLRKALR